MRRREFISALGSAVAAWPLSARAQQSSMPVVGLLRSTPAAPFKELVAALRQGLSDQGFAEGRNVVLEQRWADGQRDRLPALAADLIRLQAAVIVGNGSSIKVARAATATIPMIFVSPVALLVANLNRPEGNTTGVTFSGGEALNAKQLEIMRDLVPNAAVFGVLGDSNYRPFEAVLPDLQTAGRTLGRQLVVAKVSNEGEFDAAFEKFVQARVGALLVSGSAFFTSQRKTLVALAARHAIPAIYDQRRTVLDGGLISYAASFNDAYRQAGVYAGRILKGAKPSELPVLKPTKFVLAINLKTAKALDLDVPPSIYLRADELIE